MALLALTLSGCLSVPRVGFTAAEQAAAAPPGFDHVRWAEDDPALGTSLRAVLRPGSDGSLNILALSGGGANAAFGAGLVRRGSWKPP